MCARSKPGPRSCAREQVAKEQERGRQDDERDGDLPDDEDAADAQLPGAMEIPRDRLTHGLPRREEPGKKRRRHRENHRRRPSTRQSGSTISRIGSGIGSCTRPEQGGGDLRDQQPEHGPAARQQQAFDQQLLQQTPAAGTE